MVKVWIQDYLRVEGIGLLSLFYAKAIIAWSWYL